MNRLVKRLKREICHRRLRSSQKRDAPFCFVHINKCGGTSIERALGLPKTHDTALDVIALVGETRWREMFTFATVRHPYSRMVSDHAFRTRTGQNGLRETPLELNEWITKVFAQHDHLYYDKPRMFAPCWHWVSGPDRATCLVDQVVRLEEIASIWPSLRASLGRGKEAELHAVNATTGVSLEAATVALSAESKALLDNHFQDDFEHLGYDVPR